MSASHYEAAQQGYIDVLKALVAQPNNRSGDCDQALGLALENGHIECVVFLVPHCSMSAVGKAFKRAVGDGRVEIVQALLGFVDNDLKRIGVEWSALHDGSCIGLLAPFLDQGSLHTTLMRLVDAERVESVRKILKYVDPKLNNSEALQWASQIQCQEVFDLLYPVSDPHKAYTALRTLIAKRERIHGRSAPQQIQMLEERIALEALNHRLTHEATGVWGGRQRERKI